jgi:hypothetical protein
LNCIWHLVIVDHSEIFSEFVTLWPSDSDQSLSTQTDQ